MQHTFSVWTGIPTEFGKIRNDVLQQKIIQVSRLLVVLLRFQANKGCEYVRVDGIDRYLQQLLAEALKSQNALAMCLCMMLCTASELVSGASQASAAILGGSEELSGAGKSV